MHFGNFGNMSSYITNLQKAFASGPTKTRKRRRVEVNLNFGHNMDLDMDVAVNLNFGDIRSAATGKASNSDFEHDDAHDDAPDLAADKDVPELGKAGTLADELVQSEFAGEDVVMVCRVR